MQVARDAVAFGFDRGVRALQEPGAVLVAVLEELEKRADRLLGGLRGAHVAHQEQPAGWVGGERRGPRLEIGGAVARHDERLAGLEEARQRIRAGARLRRHPRPRLADHLAQRDPDHRAERGVGSHDHALRVQLDDPVDGGVHQQTKARLGRGRELHGVAKRLDRVVLLRDGPFELGRRVPEADLVHQGARPDGAEERGGEHDHLSGAEVCVGRDEAEQQDRAGTRDGDAEHRRPGPPGGARPANPARGEPRLHDERRRHRGEGKPQGDLWRRGEGRPVRDLDRPRERERGRADAARAGEERSVDPGRAPEQEHDPPCRERDRRRRDHREGDAGRCEDARVRLADEHERRAARKDGNDRHVRDERRALLRDVLAKINHEGSERRGEEHGRTEHDARALGRDRLEDPPGE